LKPWIISLFALTLFTRFEGLKVQGTMHQDATSLYPVCLHYNTFRISVGGSESSTIRFLPALICSQCTRNGICLESNPLFFFRCNHSNISCIMCRESFFELRLWQDPMRQEDSMHQEGGIEYAMCFVRAF
jgi:hypothetical protein